MRTIRNLSGSVTNTKKTQSVTPQSQFQLRFQKLIYQVLRTLRNHVTKHLFNINSYIHIYVKYIKTLLQLKVCVFLYRVKGNPSVAVTQKERTFAEVNIL